MYLLWNCWNVIKFNMGSVLGRGNKSVWKSYFGDGL